MRVCGESGLFLPALSSSEAAAEAIGEPVESEDAGPAEILRQRLGIHGQHESKRNGVCWCG